MVCTCTAVWYEIVLGLSCTWSGQETELQRNLVASVEQRNDTGQYRYRTAAAAAATPTRPPATSNAELHQGIVPLPPRPSV